MTGVEEAAVVAAVAPELLTAAGGTLGAEIGGMTAASALPFLGEVGAGAAGAAAGDAFLPGLLSDMAPAAIPEMAGSAVGGGMPLLGDEALLSSLIGPAPQASMPELFGVGALANSGYAQPFAMGATTAQPGLTGAFGPSTAAAAETPWLTGDKAMNLARMAGSMGQQGEQRPMGAPADFSNPLQRPGLLTQEQITKKWLKINAPDVYRRMYGGEGVM